MVVEEDVVVKGWKKQTLWLMEITVENLSDQFSSLNFAFSDEQSTGHERQSSSLITVISEV